MKNSAPPMEMISSFPECNTERHAWTTFLAHPCNAQSPKREPETTNTPPMTWGFPSTKQASEHDDNGESDRQNQVAANW